MKPALTPEEAVRIARAEVERSWSAAERFCGGDPSLFVPRILNTYRDALLTAERARLAARVKELLTAGPWGIVERIYLGSAEDAMEEGHSDALDAVLALFSEVP